jgi:uncharacterized membrane protein YdbT with pleckstrin-like domain
MSYIRDNLLPQESIVATTTLHPILFWKPIRTALLSLLFVWAGHASALLGPLQAFLASGGHSLLPLPPAGTALEYVAGFLGFLAIVGAIACLVRYRTTEFAVTDRRIIAKSGWLRHRSLEVNLDKVESVTVDQGLMARFWGYGTLRVTGTGSTNAIFWHVARPMDFRRQIQHLATP